jgi:cytochrome c peroxidase
MPSLRNIELTAPYMHDGRFQTLEQVVAFYVNRVHAHESIDRRMFARDTATYARILVHDAVGFPLTGRQRKDLVAFLKTLTDWEFVKDPRFSDPFPKSRRVAKR